MWGTHTIRTIGRASSRLVALVCICGSLTSSKVTAQTTTSPGDGTPRLRLAKQGVTLAEALTLISEKTGWNFVVDDEPLREKADLDMEGTARDVLARVTDVFDYKFEIKTSGIVTLVKRFRDPLELPQMRPSEMQRMAADLVNVLAYFRVPPVLDRFSILLRELYQSFTPAQLAHLQAGNKLYARELSLPQQTLVSQAIWDVGFGGTYEGITLLLSRLHGINASVLELPVGVPVTNDIDPRYLLLTWKDTSGVHTGPLIRPNLSFRPKRN
jgi:hypothetical protein